MNFPAVTICNQNRIHCGKLYKEVGNCIKDPDCVALGDVEMFCRLYNYGGCELSINKSESFVSGQPQSPQICQEYPTEYPEWTENDKDKQREHLQKEFLRYYSYLHDWEVALLSHDPKEMIKKCSFEAREYGDEDCEVSREKYLLKKLSRNVF